MPKTNGTMELGLLPASTIHLGYSAHNNNKFEVRANNNKGVRSLPIPFLRTVIIITHLGVLSKLKVGLR
jgi:hypothetical protein